MTKRKISAEERELIVALIKNARQSSRFFRYFLRREGKDLDFNEDQNEFQKTLYELACTQPTNEALNLLIELSNINLFNPIRGKSPLLLVMQRTVFPIAIVRRITDRHIFSNNPISQDAVDFLATKCKPMLFTAESYNLQLNELLQKIVNHNSALASAAESGATTTTTTSTLPTLELTDPNKRLKISEEEDILQVDAGTLDWSFRTISLDSLERILMDPIRSATTPPEIKRPRSTPNVL